MGHIVGRDAVYTFLSIVQCSNLRGDCSNLRYSILGDFMGHIAGGDAVNAAPPVFCAYMDVLSSLAADASGAQVLCFSQWLLGSFLRVTSSVLVFCDFLVFLGQQTQAVRCFSQWLLRRFSYVSLNHQGVLRSCGHPLLFGS